jgi:CubicO group peptidase (beta-lactamase class C family)
MHSIRVTILLFFICRLALGQTVETAKAIDEYLASIIPPSGPGASVLVMKDGNLVLRKGYGLADVEKNIAVTPDMIFRIGSITKQFTSTAILKLAAQGKLNLDDDIRKYLPSSVAQEKRVTIQQLLNHTSGIKSYTSLPALLSLKSRPITTDSMIKEMGRHPFDFDPGERFLYNNSGYFLLGVIVEKVSGISWGEYLVSNFFKPLKMKSTFYTYPTSGAQAVGYASGNDVRFVKADDVHPSFSFSAGALFSTIDDLWKWNQALFNNKIVSKEWLDQAWSPLTLNNGNQESYGFGWALKRIGDDKVIGHGGGIDGFVAYELYVPSRALYIAILSNQPGNVEEITFRLAYLTLNDPKPARIELDETILDDYAGVYEVRPGESYVIRRQEKQLTSQRTGGELHNLYAHAPDLFAFEDTPSTVKFIRSDDRKVNGLELKGRNFLVEYAPKTNQPIPPLRQAIDVAPKVLEKFVGSYQLTPAFSIVIRLEGNQLIGQATNQPPFELKAESETKFFLTVVDAQIEFNLDDNGNVTGLTLFQNGHRIPGQRR